MKFKKFDRFLEQWEDILSADVAEKISSYASDELEDIIEVIQGEYPDFNRNRDLKNVFKKLKTDVEEDIFEAFIRDIDIKDIDDFEDLAADLAHEIILSAINILS